MQSEWLNIESEWASGVQLTGQKSSFIHATAAKKLSQAGQVKKEERRGKQASVGGWVVTLRC